MSSKSKASGFKAPLIYKKGIESKNYGSSRILPLCQFLPASRTFLKFTVPLPPSQARGWGNGIEIRRRVFPVQLPGLIKLVYPQEVGSFFATVIFNFGV